MQSTFSESLRHEYPLTPDSIVFDIGGYKGEWSKIIYDRYKSQIYCFEPVFPIDNPDINLYKFGLGASSRNISVMVDRDKTGHYCQSGVERMINIIDIVEFCAAYNIHHIDLMKINIEGMEYELLPKIIDSGLVKNIDNIQVQFHRVTPTSDKDMYEIQAKLKETHSLTWQFRYIWENWKRNGTDTK